MFGHVLCLCEFLKHLSWHSSRTTELEDPTNLDLKQFCWSRDFRWLLVHGWIYGSIHLPTIHSFIAGNPSAATLQCLGAWDCDHPIAYSTCTPNSIMVFPPEIQHTHEIHEAWPSLSSMTESIKPYFPHSFPCFPLFSPCFSGHLMAGKHPKTRLPQCFMRRKNSGERKSRLSHCPSAAAAVPGCSMFDYLPSGKLT